MATSIEQGNERCQNNVQRNYVRLIKILVCMVTLGFTILNIGAISNKAQEK